MSWVSEKDDLLKAQIAQFGQAVTWKPLAGGTYVINGIFERRFIEMKAKSGLAIGGHYPTLDVRIADLPASPVKGDKVTISAIDYFFEVSMESGGGGATLVLKKA